MHTGRGPTCRMPKRVTTGLGVVPREAHFSAHVFGLTRRSGRQTDAVRSVERCRARARLPGCARTSPICLRRACRSRLPNPTLAGLPLSRALDQGMPGWGWAERGERGWGHRDARCVPAVLDEKWGLGRPVVCGGLVARGCPSTPSPCFHCHARSSR